jgi:hypothetical protein
MLKGKYFVLSLAAALVCWQVAGTDTVNSGVIDECLSTATANAGTAFGCPQGDGDALSASGLTITVTVKDGTGTGIPGIPASDFWIIGCNGGLALCGGAGSMGATAATDGNGVTTIAGDPAVGGCDSGINVVVQGLVIESGVNCDPLCLAIEVHTPDFKDSVVGCPGDQICPDLLVDFSDYTYFGTGYATAANPAPAYKDCLDLVPNNIIEFPDFTKFGVHYLNAHKC